MNKAMKPCFGGSGITEDVFQAICREIEKGDTVIELGAGDASTPALASRFVVYSVEHDPDYIGKYPVTYIHAPLVDGWYSPEVLARSLPLVYKLVLVDGPPGDRDNRSRILEHLDLFDPQAKYVIHDIHRPWERELALKMSAWLQREPRWGDEFAII